MRLPFADQASQPAARMLARASGRARGDLDGPPFSPDATLRMPLTPSGSKVLASMRDQYGPEKGERVFYATANKKPALGRKWHGKSSTAPRSLSKR